MISALYAAAVRRRRERYAARPDLRRRLARPVVSVGNLAVGGRGKTPIVASIARALIASGERPAILSRGYARTEPQDGVVVVRDPDGIRGDLARSGDEPLMLARQLPGTTIIVGADRYLAGRLAEHRFGATVHILDDGFQHLQLDRDIDLVLVGRDDLRTPVTLPGGRLREPLDTLIAADAVLADDVPIEPPDPEIPVFPVTRTLGEPEGVSRDTPVLAVAGTANPSRFFDDLRAAGWTLVGTHAFRDHHPYTARDVARLAAEASALHAAIVTTEKDYVRLLPHRPFAVPIGWVPLTMEPDPLPEFRRWLAAGIGAARDIIVG